MKFIKKILFAVIAYCFSGTITAQHIQVNDTYSAQQLIQNVLVNSPCANVANFSVGGDTFSAGQQSYGYFNAGTSGFPFANGIVLSTSRAKRTEGPNIDLIDEGSTSWLGDSDLEQALGISGSINATSLEFDFTPLTSQISFDYIFASEEYHGNAPCRYSDGFAFLLKEAGTTNSYQNLALVPNTTTPVKVTTVHPQIGGNNGCPAINDPYFDAFNGTQHPTNFNGQTVVMTAKATVIPGTTYHIKLVIADEGNIRYDSAIFLGGGSFNVGTDLGPNQLIATQNPVCTGETYILDATESGSNTYKWFKNNAEILGETNPTYTVSNTGVYKVEVNLNSTACVATGEVTIEYLPSLNPTPATIVQCDDNTDGVTIFNLTKADNLITVNDSSLLSPVYYENQTDVSPIANPTAYQTTAPKTIYARVSNAYGCFSYIAVNLQISNNSIAPQNPISTCDDDSNKDGLYHFDLNTQVTPQVLTNLPSGLIVKYYENSNDALLESNQLPNIFPNTTPFQQIIWARIINGPDCYGVIPITLVVNTFSPNHFEDETVYLCNGNPETLTIPTGFSNYSWSNGDNGINQLSTVVTIPGVYTVTVTNADGCIATKKFIVKNSEIATITSIDIHDFYGNQNSVLIHYSGNGDYEFSLDGNHFQDNPQFTDVSVGEYLVYIRDKNGCGTTVPRQIYVLGYPSYFTPNEDGRHDLWVIPFLNTQPNSTVSIFDRYGKLIYTFKENGIGWDGKFNSQDLPSSDYWFVVSLENGNIIKGHFALKR
jgi:gliding motility-associated-like protein